MGDGGGYGGSSGGGHKGGGHKAGGHKGGASDPNIGDAALSSGVGGGGPDPSTDGGAGGGNIDPSTGGGYVTDGGGGVGSTYDPSTGGSYDPSTGGTGGTGGGSLSDLVNTLTGGGIGSIPPTDTASAGSMLPGGTIQGSSLQDLVNAISGGGNLGGGLGPSSQGFGALDGTGGGVGGFPLPGGGGGGGSIGGIDISALMGGGAGSTLGGADLGSLVSAIQGGGNLGGGLSGSGGLVSPSSGAGDPFAGLATPGPDVIGGTPQAPATAAQQRLTDNKEPSAADTAPGGQLSGTDTSMVDRLLQMLGGANPISSAAAAEAPPSLGPTPVPTVSVTRGGPTGGDIPPTTPAEQPTLNTQGIDPTNPNLYPEGDQGALLYPNSLTGGTNQTQINPNQSASGVGGVASGDVPTDVGSGTATQFNLWDTSGAQPFRSGKAQDISGERTPAERIASGWNNAVDDTRTNTLTPADKAIVSPDSVLNKARDTAAETQKQFDATNARIANLESGDIGAIPPTGTASAGPMLAGQTDRATMNDLIDFTGLAGGPASQTFTGNLKGSGEPLGTGPDPRITGGSGEPLGTGPDPRMVGGSGEPLGTGSPPGNDFTGDLTNADIFTKAPIAGFPTDRFSGMPDTTVAGGIPLPRADPRAPPGNDFTGDLTNADIFTKAPIAGFPTDRFSGGGTPVVDSPDPFLKDTEYQKALTESGLTDNQPSIAGIPLPRSDPRMAGGSGEPLGTGPDPSTARPGPGIGETLGTGTPPAPDSDVPRGPYRQAAPPPSPPQQGGLHGAISNLFGGGSLGNFVASAMLQLGVPAALIMASRGGGGGGRFPLVGGRTAMSGAGRLGMPTPQFSRNLFPGTGLPSWLVPAAIGAKVGQSLDAQGRPTDQTQGGGGYPYERSPPRGPQAPQTTAEPTVQGPPQVSYRPGRSGTGAPMPTRIETPPLQPARAAQAGAQGGAVGWIQAHGGHSAGAGAPELNPVFASRLAAAGQAYERETGGKAVFGEMGRSGALQQQYYDEYRRTGLGLAAPRGTSRHEKGLATDVPNGPFQNWLHRNAARFGLQGLQNPKDPNHFQLAS